MNSVSELNNNQQNSVGAIDRYQQPPQQSIHILWILLAFIVVGFIIFVGYSYITERKAVADANRAKTKASADTDREREKMMRGLQETKGYLAIAKQAGVFDK